MIVKIVCKECEKEFKVKTSTKNDAKKIKKQFLLCSKCEFRIIANIVAKRIAKGYEC